HDRGRGRRGALREPACALLRRGRRRGRQGGAVGCADPQHQRADAGRLDARPDQGRRLGRARGQSRPRRRAEDLGPRGQDRVGQSHPADRSRRGGGGGVSGARAFVSAALLCTSLVCGYAPLAAAQTSADLVGRWSLTLEEGNAKHRGVLEIEQDGDISKAFVDGGPVDFDVDANRIELEIDTRDGGGRLLSYGLTGTFDGNALTGVLQPPLGAPEGRWHAERIVEQPEQAPNPVDFTGIWSRTSPGIAKVHLDYTPAAQAVVDDYDYLDDPALRCVSPGLVRVSGWPYPLEIVQNEQQVTILYESFHEV